MSYLCECHSRSVPDQTTQQLTRFSCGVAEILDIGVELGESDWILANVHHRGLYRVNYDVTNWQALIQQLTNNHSVRLQQPLRINDCITKHVHMEYTTFHTILALNS